jgi:hypothetical protein
MGEGFYQPNIGLEWENPLTFKTFRFLEALLISKGKTHSRFETTLLSAWTEPPIIPLRFGSNLHPQDPVAFPDMMHHSGAAILSRPDMRNQQQ